MTSINGTIINASNGNGLNGSLINGNGYPIFEANQILKFTDLNRLFAYLDRHNRLTRTHLIGMGIVCGLTIDLALSPEAPSEQPAIEVSEGCGITSEGYLIHLEPLRLTHYQTSVSVPVQLFGPTSVVGSISGGGSDENPLDPVATVIELYAQGDDSSFNNERVELGQDETGTPRSVEDMEAFLNNQVLVVVCEPEDAQRDSCLVDCDDRGRDRSFRTRFFLLPAQQDQETADANLSAERLLQRGYSIENLEGSWQRLNLEDTKISDLLSLRRTFWQRFHLQVQRFGYTEESQSGSQDSLPAVRLPQITTYQAFLQNYYEVCDRTIADIAKLFPQLFQLFSPFTRSFSPDTLNEFSDLGQRLQDQLTNIWSPGLDLDDLDATASQHALQYFYDYLSQLVAAYHELISTAFELMEDCSPDPRRFPKFLMLGQLSNLAEALGKPPSPYRSHFTQPPIYNSNDQRVNRIRHLYERLRRLCQDDAFMFQPFYDTPLQITPSRDRTTPLSQQAIPYYLNYPNLYLYWNYDAYRKGISDRHPAHFVAPPISNIIVRPPLLNLGDPTTIFSDQFNLSIKEEINLSNVEPSLTSERIIQFDVEAPVNLLPYRHDDHTFYRIEGHIGHDKNKVLQGINTYQRRYNLPFDVIALKLGPSTQEPDIIDAPILDLFGNLASEIFHEFAETNPGLEPLGGVPQGGTFVLVYVQPDAETEMVVADFCLPYRASGDLRLRKILDAVGGVLLSPSFVQFRRQFWPPLAQQGVNVTLFGRNFNATPPQVFFGDVEALVLNATDTEIVVRVPGSPVEATVNIRVVNEFGSATSNELFTFPREGYLPPFDLRFTTLNNQGVPTRPFDASQGIPGTEFRVTLVRTANVIFQTQQVEGLQFWFNQTIVPVSDVRQRLEVGGGFTFSYMDAYLQIPDMPLGEVSISVQTVFGIAVDVDTFTIVDRIPGVPGGGYGYGSGFDIGIGGRLL